MAQGFISGGNPVEDVHTRTTVSGPQSQVVVLGTDGNDAVIDAHTSRGLRVDPSGTSISSSGRKTIATAGTPAQVNAAATFTKSVFVVALPTNTQRVAIGDSSVDAADATFNGIPLEPLQGIAIDISAFSNVYLDVLGNGHGVSWVAIA